MFSRTVGKLAKSDEIMGKPSAVFLKKKINPLLTDLLPINSGNNKLLNYGILVLFLVMFR